MTLSVVALETEPRPARAAFRPRPPRIFRSTPGDDDVPLLDLDRGDVSDPFDATSHIHSIPSNWEVPENEIITKANTLYHNVAHRIGLENVEKQLVMFWEIGHFWEH